MAVTFDYYAEIFSVYDLLEGSTTDPTYYNSSSSGPTDEAVFQSMFDPGHTGTSLFLEYSLCYSVFASGTAPTYKWQYREIGGSWTDLCTGTGDVSTPSTRDVKLRDKGIYTTSITMPVEIRCVVTHASASVLFYMNDLAPTYGFLLLRAVGTI